MTNESDPTSAPKMRILVVDDQAETRELVSLVLRRAGFSVVEAATGEQGLARAAEHPDLIVLDVHLPDLSGFEVCRRIKEDRRTKDIPILQLSATLREAVHKAESLALGAESYLAHPVEPIELIATVRALLREAKARAEVRELAAEWQATFAALPDAICLVDSEGRLLRANDAFANLVGEPPDGLPGRRAADLIASRLAPGDREWIRQVRLGVEAPQEREVRIADRWYRFRIEPLRRDGNGVASAVHVISDVTERREFVVRLGRLLADAERAREQAEQASRAKDDFVAVLSHELRTPLTALLGWLSLLKTGNLSEPNVARALDTIERSARSQAQMVEDLLDMSRIVSNRLHMRFELVALGAVVESAVEAVRISAANKGLSLGVHIQPEIGLVRGDADRLRQVVWNLLTNSIKFTPSGGRVDVSVSPVHGGRAEIRVRDTGKGISPDLLPRVFDRFRQADSSTTRREGGLGLGLAIVRHIVERHGGTVEAESPGGPETGAVFVVELPVAAPPSAIDRASTPQAAVEPAPAVVLTGARVLVVEDDPDTARLISVLLEEAGAKVTAVDAVASALATIERSPPDVVVSDIGLPGMDGYALIAALRSQPSGSGLDRIPAVAVTAYAREEDRQRALAAGYDAYLSKPIDAGRLQRIVARLARGHGSGHEAALQRVEPRVAEGVEDRGADDVAGLLAKRAEEEPGKERREPLERLEREGAVEKRDVRHGEEHGRPDDRPRERDSEHPPRRPR
jgi:PAS domain S-box-containing protein